MSRKRESELAITEVITETIGGAVHVALSPKELSARQRRHLIRPAKRPKYLTTPCKVDVNLKIEEFQQRKPLERSEAWLFVNAAPPPIPRVLRYIRGLRPVKVELGQPVELDCEIEAEPEPTKIVWFKNGQEIKGDRYKKTNDLPKIALAIDRSVVNDVGEYTVLVSNGDEEIRSSAPVDLLFEKPTFVQPLPDTDVHLNQPVRLTCRLRSLPPAEVTWLASGVKIQPSDKYHLDRHDDQLTLTIDKVKVDDLKKIYTCHAINEVGEDQTSAKLKPIVPLTPPEFVEKFHDKSLEEGQPLLLNAKVTGFPKPVIKWLRGDTVLEANEHLLIAEADDGKLRLSIPEIDKEKAGIYTCVAENEAGIAKCKARISVTDKMLPPVFIVNLDNQETTEAEKIKFTCTVKGKPLPAVSWYINDELVEKSQRIQTSSTKGPNDVSAQLVIEDVAMEDHGEIKAVAKNPVGVACSVASLTVKQKLWPPVFTENMVDEQLVEDEEVSFNCTVNANPLPTITWFKDGEEIKDSARIQKDCLRGKPNEMGLSLIIPKTEMTDAGEYKVVAKNSVGEASNTARLSVGIRTSPPKIWKGPEDQVIMEDENGYFTATIEGRPQPTVQWYKDTKLINPSDLLVYSNKEQIYSLTVKNAQLNQTGLYTVKAVNVAGEVVATARLIVNEKLWAPIFTEKLIDQTIIEDDEVSLRCTVNAKPPPTIIWIKDGKDLDNPRVKRVDPKVIGNDTTMTLTITRAEIGDSGEVKVIAKNSEGEAQSSAVLKVNERTLKPNLLKGPTDLVITEDEDGRFFATISAKPKPVVQWFKDEKLLVPSATVIYGGDGEEYSLTIRNAQLDDKGVYMVKAVNDAGQITANAYLTVKEKLWPPIFTEKMADKSILENEETSFRCTVKARPLPSIKWLKDNKDIKESERFDYIIDDQNDDQLRLSLSIKDAEISDSGEIKVFARNSEGEATNSAKLIVKMRTVKPTFLKGPDDLAIIEGEDGRFTAAVTGKPEPTIQWYKDSQLIRPSDLFRVASEGNTHTLIIKNSRLEDAGVYIIKTVNEAGEAEADANLFVQEKLWAPIFTRRMTDATVIEQDDAPFKCTISAKPLPSIIWLKDGKDLRDSSRINFEEMTDENEVSLSLTLLDTEMNDTGELKVIAKNSEGEASDVAKLLVKMRTLKPTLIKGPVDQVITETEIGCFAATIDGKPDPIIQWFKNGKLTKPSDVLVQTTKDKTHSLTIKNSQLNDAGLYTIKAVNEAGELTAEARLTVNEKLWPPVFTKKMADETPLEQEQVHFRCTVNAKPGPSITWLKDGRELLDGPRIRRDCVKARENDYNVSLIINDAEMADTGELKVIAKNSEGEASQTARLTVRTRNLKPTLLKGPDDMEVTEDEESFFTVIVDGKPEPKVQWYKDNELLIPSPLITHEKKNQTHCLRIMESKLDDQGVYVVKAVNVAGEITAKARLTVNERLWPPEFRVTLTDEQVIEKDEVGFHCIVSAKPLPAIVWFKDGKELEETPRIRQESEPGKSLQEKYELRLFLTLCSAELNDSGEYQVVAKNSEGEASDVGILKVNKRMLKPALIKGPSDLTIKEDEDGYFLAAFSGIPEPAVQWFKDKKHIEPSNVKVYSIEDETYKLRIINAKLDDAGVYIVRATNEAGEAAADAKLTVIEKLWAPIFTKKMADDTITERDKVSLRCTVSAKPLPSITWMKDGKSVTESPMRKLDQKTIKENEVNVVLTIEEAEMTDSGNYKVIAKNTEGEASNSATIDVKMRTLKPTLLRGPTDVIVTEEEDGCFFAAFEGRPEPNIQWFKDHVPITPTDTMIYASKDQTHSLTIAKAELADGGVYTVRASNVAGEYTASARLTVKEKLWAPVFTERMADQSLIEKDVVYFRCTVSAKPLPDLTWLKDGKEMKDNARVQFEREKQKDNELKIYLTVSDAEIGDSGDFKIIARNSEGEATNSAHLHIKPITRAPSLLRKPEDLVLFEEEDGCFTATIDGKPEPNVQWFKGGRLVKPSDRMVSTKQDQTYILTVKDAELSYADVYTVRAINEAGEITADARLIVKEKLWPPVFTEQLVDRTAIEHEEIRFRCTVNAKPAPQFKLMTDGRELKTDSRIILDSLKGKENEWKLSLIIRDAEISDSGEIKIVATNTEGQASTVAKLTVNMITLKPVISKGPSDLVIFEGQDGYFSATITGKPDPKVEWFVKDRLIEPSDFMVYSDMDQMYSLTVMNAQLSDTGEYTVKAVNKVGEVSAKAKLTVKELLWAPEFTETMTSLTVKEEDEIFFHCVVSAKPLPVVTWLKGDRELKEGHGVNLEYAKRGNAKVTLSLAITNAKLTDSGEFSVLAKNSEGEAINSAFVTVIVRPIKPTLLKGPTDLVITEDEDACFTSTITGKPEPTIQWLKNKLLIKPSDQAVYTSKDQTFSLTIKNAKLGDSGTYTIRAANEEGELFADAKLTVKEKLWAPIFIEKMESKTPMEQEEVPLRCIVSAKPAPTITWERNGKELRDDHRIRRDLARGNNNEFKPSLTISKAELSDSGDYKVTAINSEGKAVHTFSITVIEMTVKPILLKGPADLIVTEEEDARFESMIGGKPEPSVQWFKNKVLIKPSDHVVYASKDQTFSLTIKKSELGDAGIYTVKASNKAGDLSADAKLTVKEKLWAPIFTEKQHDKTLEEEEEIYLRCAVNAKPAPTIHWERNGKELKDDHRMRRDLVRGTNNEFKPCLRINKVELSDAGDYRVIAVNSEGRAVHTFSLTVIETTVKTTLMKGPADLVVTENEDARFETIIGGKPEPTVQWFKNKVLIKPSDHAVYASKDQTFSLTIKKSELGDAGIYTVTASNKGGDLSADAKLTVKEKLWAPIFTEKEHDKSHQEEEEIYLRCAVNAKPAPTIQWERNGEELKDDHRTRRDLVRGTNNEFKPCITINKAQLSDAGDYRVTAVNSEGKAVHTFSLTVFETTVKTALLRGPADLIVTEEEDARFETIVGGKPEPTVQWFKNKVLIKPSDHAVYASKDQTFSLTIKKAELGDAGIYTVKASNKGGDLSADAKLTVKEKLWAPIFTEKQHDKSYDEQEEIYLRCAVNAKPAPTIHWERNGEELKDDHKIRRDLVRGTNNEFKPSLTISKAELRDSGDYRVTAVNSEGKAVHTFSITIFETTVKTTLLRGPADLVVTEHEDARFESMIGGKPEPTVQWFKNEVLIKPSSHAVYASKDQTFSLTIKKSELNDAGIYTVKASNKGGDLSADATLTVKEKLWAPIFTEKQQDKSHEEEDEIYLRCAVNAKPAPTIHWERNGEELRDDHRIRRDLVRGTNNEFKPCLTIKKAELSDAGDYRVTAVNSEGKAVHTFSLTLSVMNVKLTLLRGPADLVVTENEDACFEMMFNGRPEPTIQWFKNEVLIKPSDQMIHAKKDQMFSLTIKKAQLGDAGLYTVKAVNADGELSAKAKLTVNAQGQKPMVLTGPSNLKVDEGETATFTAVISGKPQPKVEWFKNRAGLPVGGRYEFKSDGNEYKLIVKNTSLSDAGLYTVHAKNAAGEARASATLEVKEVAPYFIEMLNDVEVSVGMPARFTCKVHPEKARVVWYSEDERISSSDPRYRISSKGNERTLEIVKTTRFDNGQFKVELGELQSKATLTVEASETEIVEGRLLWQIIEDALMEAAAEFQCKRGSRASVIHVTTADTTIVERAAGSGQRRWVVEKAYINRTGQFRVDRWMVRSFVDITCSEDALKDVAQGIMDRAKYSVQTVEFLILLTEPTSESKWQKGGKPIQNGDKYKMEIEQDGELHKLTISDVQESDEGIYTFMVLRRAVETHVEVQGAFAFPPTSHLPPTPITPTYPGFPARLMSMKSRQDVSTEDLMSQLQAPIRKAKSHKQMSINYDGRSLSKAPSHELLQDQLHGFDSIVTGVEEPEEGDFSDDVIEGVLQDEQDDQPKRRASMGASSAFAPLRPLSQSSRSGSVSSLTGRGKKPEIIYFSYVESGKDKSEF